MAKIEPFYVEVGQRIRDHRTKIGKTQEDLGQLLSPPMTRVSIANIEGGNQRVLSHTLVQFADALKVDVSDILPPSKEPKPKGNTAQLTAELVSKLGVTESVAQTLTGTERSQIRGKI